MTPARTVQIAGVLALLVAGSLTACSGGGHHAATEPSSTTASVAGPPAPSDTTSIPRAGGPTTTYPKSFVPLGAAVVLRLPCLTCHTTSGAAAAGPTFKDLAGSTVKLADGTTVVADDAYLERSILDPDAQTVAGYGKHLMGSIIKPGTVSPRQAKEIVAYLHTLSSATPSG